MKIIQRLLLTFVITIFFGCTNSLINNDADKCQLSLPIPTAEKLLC